MTIKLHKMSNIIESTIDLPGSKSISNRVLIIKALSGLDFSIANISNSDDTNHLKAALDTYSNSPLIDVGHAGTDMRFLTAFLSIKHGSYELTGSQRLQQRPVKGLVDVLKKLGANITYKNNQGYPPLLINGMQIDGGKVEIDGNISSQFITALLLVAPYFKNGLELTITSELVSKPYVLMTIEIMREFGASIRWENNHIVIKPISYTYFKKEYVVESDWSAASYYYSIVAFSEINTTLKIKGLFQKSLQADAICNEIYKNFGIETLYANNEILITKTQNTKYQSVFNYNFLECPDIAQTVVVTCLGLKQAFHFTGLETLKVKETDRIVALQNECKKLGVDLVVTENSIKWNGEGELNTMKLISVATYNDHRMAMSFSALSMLLSNIVIEEASVVSKSYPLFWEHLSQIGILSK